MSGLMRLVRPLDSKIYANKPREKKTAKTMKTNK